MSISTHIISGALLFALATPIAAGTHISGRTILETGTKTSTQIQGERAVALHGRAVRYRSQAGTRKFYRRNSKTRTALTIAAPAAVGAGVGVLAGGKKGAAAGALLGGGGGALYHLIKTRRR